MRLVIDTDVVVAGIRSPTGASAALLLLVLAGRATMLLSVALAIEYEATCCRAEHLLAAEATRPDVINLFEALFAVIEPVEVHYQWRPQLSDAGDELVLETAINGRADAIVTFNRKHYAGAAERFGIKLVLPAETLRRIRT